MIVSLLTVVIGAGLGIGNAVARISRNSDETIAKQLDSRIALVVIAGVLSLVSAIVFLSLIRQLSTRHMRSTREV